MTKVNPNNGIEIKSDKQIILDILMFFIIGTFRSHCKSEYIQVKWNKITRDMCKSDSIFPCLQGSTLFKNDFWKLFLDKVYLKNVW